MLYIQSTLLKNLVVMEKCKCCIGCINTVKKKAKGKRMDVKAKNSLPLWLRRSTSERVSERADVF